jgi:hypothetical protein
MNVWTRKSADDPYCANCSLTWDMHIAGSNACPSTEYHIRRLVTKLGETCKHGGLRRSCETCDLAEQLDACEATMRRDREEYQAALQRHDFDNKALQSRLDAAIKERDALSGALSSYDDMQPCDCCGNYSASTADTDDEGNPLGHVQCAQCSRIAELESRLDAAEKLTEAVRQAWRDDREETKAERNAALKQRDELLLRLSSCRTLVNEQAEDEGLWFVAATAAEAYLQQELRKLHAAIEAAPSAPSEKYECPMCATPITVAEDCPKCGYPSAPSEGEKP